MPFDNGVCMGWYDSTPIAAAATYTRYRANR